MPSPRRARHGGTKQAEGAVAGRTFPEQGIAKARPAHVGRSHRDGNADRHQPGAVRVEKADRSGQTREALREDAQGQERGRDAETPAEIPAKGWKDIAWRVYDGIQNDRVLLVAAGVTFYALLALFPATAALVSLYGLFADPSTINEHLRLASGFLPEGALEVIGDQVKRIASQKGTLGFTFVGTLALALWGANAGTKAIFDALNIIYKEREKRSFIGLTAAIAALHRRRRSR